MNLKLEDISHNSNICWKIVVTDRKDRRKTQSFTLDPRYGSVCARFYQLLGKAIDADPIILTAVQGTTMFPLKLPFPARVSTSNNERMTELLLKTCSALVRSGWTPIFETFDGRRQWEVEAQRGPGIVAEQEETTVHTTINGRDVRLYRTVF